MEKEDEFLHTYFNHVSQLCYEKAKEHLVCKKSKYDKQIYLAFCFRKKKKN